MMKKNLSVKLKTSKMKKFCKKMLPIIFCVGVLLFLTSCGVNSEDDGLGFIDSEHSFSWVMTIVWLIIVFAPVLLMLIQLFERLEDQQWDSIKNLYFIYGGIASLLGIVCIIVCITDDPKDAYFVDIAVSFFLMALVAFISAIHAIKKEKEYWEKLEEKRAIETKCHRCGKLSAMQEVKRVCTGSRATTVYKTIPTRNRNGEVIATTEVPVPATEYDYDVYLCCRFCNYKSMSQTYRVSEN
jgi:hypothetical protein